MNEDAKAAKTRRLAEALRANLRRRKAAGSAKAPEPAPSTGEAGAAAARDSKDEG